MPSLSALVRASNGAVPFAAKCTYCRQGVPLLSPSLNARSNKVSNLQSQLLVNCGVFLYASKANRYLVGSSLTRMQPQTGCKLHLPSCPWLLLNHAL